MSRISLVTVTYNNSAATIELLENLKCVGHRNLDQVIIVDNASSNTDYEKLRAFLRDTWEVTPRPQLIRNSRNLGYFGGLNTGIERLVGDHKAVVICNNDVTFDDEFFLTIKEHAWPKDVHVICPDILTADGLHQNPHVRHRLSWARRLAYKIYFSNYWLGLSILYLKRLAIGIREPETESPGEIYMGVGACYVLTASFFAQNSRLDDRIFLWGEEALLANQVTKSAGKLWFDPTLKVTHKKSSTTHLIPGRKQYKMAKDSYRIYRRYL